MADGASHFPKPPSPPHEVTLILESLERGDPAASERLLPLVYQELRALARSLMAREKGQTLQATALVHEAYLRLVGSTDLSWNSRRHFFGAAAQAMRRILVERARRRDAVKHGGAQRRIEMGDDEIAALSDPSGENEHKTDLVALDSALDALATYDSTKADIVMLKYFAGMTNDEVAAALGVSSATVRREWSYSRAWLMRWLEERAGGPSH
jgi:RNA polymerase sigma factor (TIGR02999 family)